MIESLKLNFSSSFIIKWFYYIFLFVSISIFSYSFCLSFFRQPLSLDINYCISFDITNICGFLFFVFFHFKYYIYLFLLLVLFSFFFFENYIYLFLISFLFSIFSFLLFYFEFVFYDVDLIVVNLYLNNFDFFSDWKSDHFFFNFFSEIQIKYSSFEIYSSLLSYHFKLYICEDSWCFIFKSKYPIVANAKVLEQFKTIALNSSTMKEALLSSNEFVSNVDNIIDFEKFMADHENLLLTFIHENFDNIHSFYTVFTLLAIFNRPFVTKLLRLDQLFFRPGINPIVPYEPVTLLTLLEDHKKYLKACQYFIELLAQLTGFSGVGCTIFKVTIFDFVEFVDACLGKTEEMNDIKKIVHEQKKDVGKVFISPELIETLQKKRSIFKE